MKKKIAATISDSQQPCLAAMLDFYAFIEDSADLSSTLGFITI